MTSQQGTSSQGPPYLPQNHSLGGIPDILPDVPISASLLVIYLIFAIVHMTILQKNNRRSHKFIFSGAMFGFCAIRLFTMSLRIAWACHNKSVRLGIAAQIFVYVGTVILFMTNWFFTQRVIRAQHPHWGWSMPYRIFHIGSLAALILCLLLLIVAAIQSFYTLDSNIHRIDRDFQLTGLTYFAVFSFGPIALLAISGIIPRKEVDKFGAGRLRNNIDILIVSTIVLTLGTSFRAGTNWLNPVPLSAPSPWYFSKVCFYCFNFVTEIVVVIFYALVRVDLRFHVPNGAKGPGSYSQFSVNVIGDEKQLQRLGNGYPTVIQPNNSTTTLETYQDSLFDDTRTLADSLRYPSSTLELDTNTGYWKLRGSRRSSMGDSFRLSNAPSLWSPETDHDNEAVPPVPDIPDWPLRESQVPSTYKRHSRQTVSTPPSSRQERTDGKRSSEIPGHGLNNTDLSEHIQSTMAQLEYNSEGRRKARAVDDAKLGTAVAVPRRPPTTLQIGKGKAPVQDKRRAARLQKMNSSATERSWNEGDDKPSLKSKRQSAPAVAAKSEEAETHHCRGCRCHSARYSSNGTSVASSPIAEDRTEHRYSSDIVERGRKIVRER